MPMKQNLILPKLHEILKTLLKMIGSGEIPGFIFSYNV